MATRDNGTLFCSKYGRTCASVARSCKEPNWARLSKKSAIPNASDDALAWRCVRCAYFRNTNERGAGCCVGNAVAYKHFTGKSFTRWAPEGPSFRVRKLDGCPFWISAWNPPSGVCKAISLTQPFATLIMLGEKEYETRCWHTKFRGPVWIHASKGFPGWAKKLCATEPFASVLARHGYPSWKELPTGSLLGTVEWRDCEHVESVLPRICEQEVAFGYYTDGRFASLVGNPVALARPIPCKGALGFWRVPDDALISARELCACHETGARVG